jgi:hypothetical protein
VICEYNALSREVERMRYTWRLLPFGRLSYETPWYGGSFYWVFAMSWSVVRPWGLASSRIEFHPLAEAFWFHPLAAPIFLSWIIQVLFFAAIIRNMIGQTSAKTILILGLLSLVPLPISGFVYYRGNAIAIPIPIYLLVGLVIMICKSKRLENNQVQEDIEK